MSDVVLDASALTLAVGGKSAAASALRVQLAGLVTSLVKELDIPVVQVTHNHGEARAMGDRLLLVRDGKIVAEGPVADLLSRDPSLFMEM